MLLKNHKTFWQPQGNEYKKKGRKREKEREREKEKRKKKREKKEESENFKLLKLLRIHKIYERKKFSQSLWFISITIQS